MGYLIVLFIVRIKQELLSFIISLNLLRQNYLVIIKFPYLFYS